MKTRLATLALLAVAVLGLGGCNYYSDATNAVSVTKQILTIAQTDIPSLQVAGFITATEATNIGNYLSAGLLLDSQADSCVAAAHTLGDKKAAFVACFTTFATGLADPKELALLRVVNPKGQSNVQLYVTAAILAVNGVLQIMNAIQTPVPVIADMPPTHKELVAFARRAGIDPAYGY